MPEGHSIHRVARFFERTLVGQRINASSPQGRFADGAAAIHGETLTRAFAVGKHLFLEFSDTSPSSSNSTPLFVRVHLGIYGAWDFQGNLDSPSSIGAPRQSRIRVGEEESMGAELRPISSDAGLNFPPEPVGAVRLRLWSDEASGHQVCADLRGPTACELIGPTEVASVLERLGPDPLIDSSAKAGKRFADKVLASRAPIGQILMDQSVVSGIGNVYRAELLFRARLNPFTPGNQLEREQVLELWRDWAKLLRIGVETGVMLTRDGLRAAKREQALTDQSERHWVYGRAGLPCRVCGTHIVLDVMATRKLYFCPSCQAG